MTTSLIQGRYVIQGVDSTGTQLIRDGAVFQRDGVIEAVGPYSEFRNLEPDVTLGSPDSVVMPGLVNSHFHIGLTPFQLGAPDAPLEQWGLEKLGRKRVDGYLEHLFAASQMLLSGTTTVHVLHYLPRGVRGADVDLAHQVLRAYEEAGMRVAYGMSAVDQNGLLAGSQGGDREFGAHLPPGLAERFITLVEAQYLPVEEYVGRVETLISAYKAKARVRITVTPSSVERCSQNLLVALAEVAEKAGTVFHIHVLESPHQRSYAKYHLGMSPLEYLDRLGVLNPSCTCVHCVWASEKDIEVLTRTDAIVSHNPSSNLRLSSGIAPISLMEAEGVRVALGTDEATIDDNHDMFREMKLALYLQRAPNVPNPIAPERIFAMATVGSAESLGMGTEIGRLEPGRRADLLVLDLPEVEGFYVEPSVPLLDRIVVRAQARHIRDVMVDGRIVVQDRSIRTVDVPALARELAVELSRETTMAEEEQRNLASELYDYVRQFLSIDEISGEPHYLFNTRMGSF